MSKKSKFQYSKATLALRKLCFSDYHEPGERFLTFDELEQRLDFSRKALQGGVEQLKEDGVLVSRGRNGMFISESSPMLKRIAMVFHAFPEDTSWSLMDQSFQNQARILEKEHQLEIPRYYGVRAGSEILEKIQKEIREYRIAGLLVVGGGNKLIQLLRKDRQDVPILSVFALALKNPEVPFVHLNGNTFWKLANEIAVSRGHKRIAIISMAELFREELLETKTKLFKIPKHWIQAVDRHHPKSAINIIGLLMDYPPSFRPTVLVVGDDNLLPVVLEGLKENGLEPGNDVEIISHCNWPLNEEPLCPIHWVGAPTDRIFRDSVTYLQRCRSEEVTPPYDYRYDYQTTPSDPTGKRPDPDRHIDTEIVAR